MLFQVYATGRLVFKPPRTPPYLLLLYYGINMFSGLADLAAAILNQENDLGIIVLIILHATSSLVLLWLAGTFPLEEILPCANVGTAKDVSMYRYVFGVSNIA
jgi:hypothetical protein